MSSYLKYWGVDTPVFSPGHGASDFYMPERLRLAIERVQLFCEQEQSFIALHGESGTGKSTLLRWLHDAISTDSHEFLLTTLLREETGPNWLAPRLANYFGLGLQPDATPADLIKGIAGRMDDLIEHGRKLVIAVDAAHLIQDKAWQDISGLLNLGSLAGSCFSFLLVGRPELMQHISTSKEMSTRLSCQLAWPAFTEKETAGYLAFRCEIAGMKNPFHEESIPYLQQTTGGIASAINALAENALIEAHQRKTRIVTGEIARTAGHFVQPMPQTSRGDSVHETDTPVETVRLADLTKEWVPPPPTERKPRSPAENSDATIRMKSLFKPRDKDNE